MKKALTIGLAGLALAAAISFIVAGGSFKRQTGPVVHEAVADEAELAPLTIASNGHVSSYVGVARIIQVPQRGELARANGHEQPEVTDNDAIEPITPPPPRKHATPRWPRQNSTPPAPGPRRTVLSAPPQAEGPTPIRPTPRYNSNPVASEPLNTPDRDAIAQPPSLPPDTIDPATLPRD